VSERVPFEQEILMSPHIFGVVVRPAFVFGKRSTHFVNYFDQSIKGKVVVPGNKDIGWSEVHIDDLVDGYRRIVESLPSNVGGQIFNFADGSRYTNFTIAQRFAQYAGYTGTVEVDEKLAREFSNKIVFVDSRKAQRMLGWQPKHKLLLDQVEVLYRTWLARHPEHAEGTKTSTKESFSAKESLK